MKNIACVILAAGKGTRMNSAIPKPLHEIHSRPMLGYLIDTVRSAGVGRITLVLGHGADKVKSRFKDYNAIIQERQLGSGDAINVTRGCFEGDTGDILVLYSDTPLIKTRTIKALIHAHRGGDYGCTLLAAMVDNPGGYGRIVRDDSGKIMKIVEEKNTNVHERAINEINVGAYVFKRDILYAGAEKIKINKGNKEYYLTDIIDILRVSGIKINSLITDDASESMGINSRIEQAAANDVIRKRVLSKFMEQGVTITDPLSTRIDFEAEIGPDTVIYPHTIIERNVRIGGECKIGPFAHLRPGTSIGDRTEIGNFVELVRTTIGKDCRIKHKTYLGDTDAGNAINIGAGTITANYDGKNKNKTVIKDGAFIGVGCILIAPVTVGRKALIGAGSVVTKGHDVPDGETVIGIPARVMRKR